MEALAAAVLVIHLSWILWVIFGALWTRGRPWLAVFHVLSLVWGIIVEVGPWPCPLTLAEQWFEAKASQHTWTGGFLVHCLDSTGLSKPSGIGDHRFRRGGVHVKPGDLWVAVLEGRPQLSPMAVVAKRSLTSSNLRGKGFSVWLRIFQGD